MDAITYLTELATALQRAATDEYNNNGHEGLYAARVAVIKEIWAAVSDLQDRVYGPLPF